tara:strand:+ start:335 stop:625 length:291 start_codon:yes stop_codon:yes gene_type:complete
MKSTDIIAYVGMTISFFVTVFIIYSAVWGWRRRNWVRRNRRNRISPEMFDVLARVILERNAEMVRRREIELTEVRNKYKHTVIVINPDEKIQIGTI